MNTIENEVEDNAVDEQQYQVPAIRQSEAPIVLTPAQARVDSVSRTMDAAMNKASTLQLTPEEVVALKADFPDEAFKPGAAGKEHLIYIEHAFLRDRLDSALGMGQWALIRTRPHWAEEFITEKGNKATRIYADCALLVRGCMVSEAIGDMVYYPNNPSQNYGDAAEGAMTAAFRRCAKNFGIGLQAWKKDFGDGWWKRQRAAKAAPRSPAPAPRVETPQSSSDTPQTPESTPVPVAPSPKLTAKEKADAFLKLLNSCKSKFLSQVKPVAQAAKQYFEGLESHGLLPTEELADIPASSLFPHADVDATPEANHAAIRADRDRHMAGIKAILDAENQIPGAEVAAEPEETGAEPAPEPRTHPPGTESRRIRVKATSAKDGTGKNGKPYTKYGVVDDNSVWYNHFSDTLNADAEALKGMDATVWFTTREYNGKSYFDLVDIQPA